MNINHIITDTWSNDTSRKLYESNWPDEPTLRLACEKVRSNAEDVRFLQRSILTGTLYQCKVAASPRIGIRTFRMSVICLVKVGGRTVSLKMRAFIAGAAVEGSEYWDGIAKLFQERPTDGTS